MNEPNMIFMPHSSARLRNVELRNRHKQLIEQKKLVDAANLIKDRKDVDAFTASLFNSLEQKIVYVESLLSPRWTGSSFGSKNMNRRRIGFYEYYKWI